MQVNRVCGAVNLLPPSTSQGQLGRCCCHMQKLHQRIPELEKSTAVALEKMRLEEAARRKLEERLITVSCMADTAYASPYHPATCFPLIMHLLWANHRYSSWVMHSCSKLLLVTTACWLIHSAISTGQHLLCSQSFHSESDTL